MVIDTRKQSRISSAIEFKDSMEFRYIDVKVYHRPIPEDYIARLYIAGMDPY